MRLSQRGEIYMNKQEIMVDLITDGEKELLVFNFDETISLDLTSESPEDLKSFFQKLLKKIENKNVEIKFNETDRKDLFYDVAKKYVEHLKTEISSIVSQKLNIIEIDDETAEMPIE